MRIDILTLFPGMFRGPFEESILKRAVDSGLLDIRLHNIRDYTSDKHHVVDDSPYGGGAGMVMKPEPIFAAVEAIIGRTVEDNLEDREGMPPIVLLTPQGRLFNHRVALELASHPRLVLICGHYEGVDERVVARLATDQISIGDYILTGGELPAMVVVDAVARLVSGALGSPASSAEESFSEGLLEYPQYTRPPVFRGWDVPQMLLSGNHGEIARWRRQQALLRTLERRPDLLAQADLTEEERKLVLVSEAM
ncbi:MAG: trmD [Dehalococcoidia bacterium]|nr:trmD [Dehalococcoidia bacterium]